MEMSKTITLVALSVVATLSISTIMGFQVSDITAQKTEKNPYKTAEDLRTTMVFKFREGTELVPVQTFIQKSGFGGDFGSSAFRDTPTFEIQKVPGNTPYLYEAADESQKYRGRNVGVEYPYKFFDVEIMLAKGGKVIRQFNYQDCTVVSYKVDTLSDKEEAYFGKGFAIIDQFEFECNGYKPDNPIYYQMKNNLAKANTTSSKDLKSTDKWNKQMKNN